MSSLFRHTVQGWGKIRSLVPLYGLWGTFKIVVKNILWVERMCRLEKNLGVLENPIQLRIALKIVPYVNDLQFKRLEDRSEILTIRGNYGLQQFRKRFERGDIMFAAYREDKFVGFVWIEFPPVNDAGYSLEEGEAYTYDGWTFECIVGIVF